MKNHAGAWLAGAAAVLFVGLAAAGTAAGGRRADSVKPLPRVRGVEPRNVVLILADDHRYDALGFMHPFLETPHLDALAKGGAHLRNAFVTTSLCSPSRASILTGLYTHRHGVVDNNNPVRPDLVFFPQYLRRAGYETAFIGKWHMGGESDAPQRGFDHWVSFRGQGTYLPGPAGLNVDGRRVPQKGHLTDELTDYAVEWLRGRSGRRPFFLYLSHKAVHAHFDPAERHRGRYRDRPVPRSPAMARAPEDAAGRPMWVQNQRNSWHGVDFPYHRAGFDLAAFYRESCETLLSLDDSVGRVMEHLRQRKLLDSTLVLYLSDNGFMFGEHGLIDKRAAYEASIRIPMLAHCPELIRPGTVVKEVVANIDVAPTLLEAAGLRAPESMDGRSFLPLLRGRPHPWREALLYEYYWERNFPQTPTQFALRGDRFKYIRPHGVWDTDELYDLEADPHETRNLIRSPEHQQTAREMNRALFAALERTGGLQIPLLPDRGGQQNLRLKSGPPAAPFPTELLRERDGSR